MPSKRSAPAATSEAGPSRSRRKVVEDVSEDEDLSDGGEEYQDDQTQEQTQRGKGLAPNDIKRYSAKLVKLALTSEYQRKPLRRENILKEVMPNAKTAFNEVFNQAQISLRQTFGMELYEVRGRSKGSSTLASETQATQARTQAQTQKRKPRRLDDIQEEDEEEEDGAGEANGQTQTATESRKGPGTRIYILRSILPAELLELVSRPRPLPAFNIPLNNNMYDTDHVDSGALIPWEKADGGVAGHVAMLGIRTIILCLVMCTGRMISDDHLHALLKRLNLLRETILQYSSSDSKEPHVTLDKYLDLLARQQYLEKVKVPGPAGTDPTIEWRWGNREAEFTEGDAAAFIEKVFSATDPTPDSEEEEEEEEEDVGRRNGRRGRPSGQNAGQTREVAKQKARERLRKDIIEAVGGPLEGEI